MGTSESYGEGNDEDSIAVIHRTLEWLEATYKSNMRYELPPTCSESPSADL